MFQWSDVPSANFIHIASLILSFQLVLIYITSLFQWGNTDLCPENLALYCSYKCFGKHLIGISLWSNGNDLP